MKIKKASASFGKLNGDTLELAEGLNIVTAPNESGKSTWCAFIRTMLFGLNTADRDKAGYLSDKTKYRPWHSGPLEGSMDITHGGQDITIRRTALGKSPMKDFSAVITGTEIAVPGINGENAGVLLTGVTKPVFERSAFIRQSGMQISQTGELEKRIASIVSSGDESVSYTEADKKLRAWTRRRKYNNSGAIPTLQAQIKEKLDTLERIRFECEETARLRAEQDRLLREKELLENELAALDALDEIENVKYLEYLRRDALEKEMMAKAVWNDLSRYGTTDDDILNALRADVTALESFEGMENSAENKRSLAESDYLKIQVKVNSHPLGNLSVSEADDACDKAEQLEAESAKSKKRAKTLTVVFAILAVLAAAVGVFVPSPVNLVLWAAALILLAACICVNVTGKKPAAELLKLLESLHIKDTPQFRALVSEYTELCAGAEVLRAELHAADSAYKAAHEARENHIEGMWENARKVDPEIEDILDLGGILNRISSLKQKYAKIRSLADMATTLYKAKESSRPAKSVEMPDITPRYEKSRTQASLNDTVRRIANTDAAYNMTLGRLKASGDPMILEGEIKTLREELDMQTAQFEALTLASEVLAEADNEIHTRFAPVLAKTAGTIFSRITGGKYDMLAFDKSLDAAAQAKGDTTSKNVLYLSEGASDQIYLSLRLAVCQLALDSDEPCPIILDDAFASFDDERMGYALEYLKDLAKTRQVIIFSCHSREAAFFAKDPEVNLISL